MSNSMSPSHYTPVDQQLKYSKNCHFFVNGDRFATSKKVCVSHKVKTLDVFMNELGEKLQPKLRQAGTVRRICTPVHGTRVRDIGDFREGEHYVAIINDKFKPISYPDIPNRTYQSRLPPLGQRKIDYFKPVVPVKHAGTRYQQEQARALQQGHQTQGTRLRLHWERDTTAPCKTLLIPHKNKDETDYIITHIADKLGVGQAYFNWLYLLVGGGGSPDNYKLLWRKDRPEQITIENNMHLLATNRKADTHEVYFPMGRSGFSTSPRASVSSGPNTPQKRSDFSKYRKLPGITPGSNSMSPMSNVSGSQGGRGRNRQRPARQVNYDRDGQGPYRAKNSGHAQDARQERMNGDAAAAKIQAGFHGMKVRNEYAEKRREAREARDRQYESSQRDAEDYNRRQDDAASRIQASYRGHRVRKDMRDRKGRK